jgi:hypothetical protein
MPDSAWYSSTASPSEKLHLTRLGDILHHWYHWKSINVEEASLHSLPLSIKFRRDSNFYSMGRILVATKKAFVPMFITQNGTDLDVIICNHGHMCMKFLG